MTTKIDQLSEELKELLEKSKISWNGDLTAKDGDDVFILHITENVPTLNVCQANKS